MKAITLRHVSNCHFERSEAESRNLLSPCSPPLHWPHSIERNAGSFLRWQSCIGLPSRVKLALRRAAMEQHCHSYPRTPYVVRHRKEGPFMGRLRANLSALGNPLQDFHSLKGQRELRGAPSFCLPDRDGAGRSPEDRAKKFFKDFFPRGSKNRTFCDINNRGMKRSHEMMHPISKRPSSTSAVRRRAGE